MIRYKKLISMLVMMLACLTTTRSVNYFTIQDKDGQRTKMAVDRTFSETTVINPFTEKNPISGLCITGSISKENDDYLVRVILKDDEGHEHCVLESYDMINDASSFSFTDYCEETALLDNIEPDSLIIVTHFATLRLNSISVIYNKEPGKMQKSIYSTAKANTKKAQVDSIVNRINSYNKSHRKLWGAGVTPLAQKSYEQKKVYLGLTNEESSEGFEYYCSGIFESGSPSQAQRANSSSCVSQFDWCNRHGRSWITGIRDQGNSAFCFAFAAVAAIESMLMLYYNSNDSVILSADQAARCTYNGLINTYERGGLADDVLRYAKNDGICDDSVAPFIDTDTIPCKSGIIVPNELVKISDFQSFTCYSEDCVKEKLIEYGPLTSGYIGHAMLLVGYGVIQVGDVIRVNYGVDNTSSNYTVQPCDTNYIGKTYWKFKNSYGYNPNLSVNGYAYILFNNLTNMRSPCSVVQPYRTINISANKSICEDADGDGYYFWGISDKPTSLPSWVPDSIDGNDNDYLKGKLYLDNLHVIGELETINPNGIQTLTISSNTIYTTRQYIRKHIVIPSNKTLTVKNILNMFGRPTITVQSGGQLIVDGGVITNANINLAAGSKLELINGGKIVMRTSTSFNTPVDALVDITHGEILRSNYF